MLCVSPWYDNARHNNVLLLDSDIFTQTCSYKLPHTTASHIFLVFHIPLRLYYTPKTWAFLRFIIALSCQQNNCVRPSNSGEIVKTSMAYVHDYLITAFTGHGVNTWKHQQPTTRDDLQWICFCNSSLPWSVRPLDLIYEYWIEHVAIRPLYVKFVSTTRMGNNGVLGFKTDWLCSSWCLP